MMKKMWKKMLAVGLIGGAIMFQTPTCTQSTAELITAGASLVTAGGVLYLVDRVVRN